ncbi:hypothetical protein [Planomonospora parontospora]|uniref:hypothetical protein n=1 Tax=Planomonospora parontospora TaxID=58119 RepID=UPI0016708B2F|nr:hypothetical protein [Planomonospora parontospora]
MITVGSQKRPRAARLAVDVGVDGPLRRLLEPQVDRRPDRQAVGGEQPRVLGEKPLPDLPAEGGMPAARAVAGELLDDGAPGIQQYALPGRGGIGDLDGGIRGHALLTRTAVRRASQYQEDRGQRTHRGDAQENR